MSFVLLIWFSVGVAPVEHFDNSAACFKRLNELVPLYAKRKAPPKRARLRVASILLIMFILNFVVLLFHWRL